jgi:hypothetical protein
MLITRRMRRPQCAEKMAHNTEYDKHLNGGLFKPPALPPESSTPSLETRCGAACACEKSGVKTMAPRCMRRAGERVGVCACG